MIYALEVKDKSSDYYGIYIILIKCSQPEWDARVIRVYFDLK